LGLALEAEPLVNGVGGESCYGFDMSEFSSLRRGSIYFSAGTPGKDPLDNRLALCILVTSLPHNCFQRGESEYRERNFHVILYFKVDPTTMSYFLVTVAHHCRVS